MKEVFEKIAEFIDRNNKSIVKLCVSILGCIILTIFICISTDNFTVSNESNQLSKYVEERNYSLAISYYEKIKEEFSEPKMDRFSKSFSKKINKTLMNYGERYIKNEIGKEYYISLINIINELDIVSLDMNSILNQAKRVNELYLQENLSYTTTVGYMQSISTLKVSKNDIDAHIKKIEIIEDSRKMYNVAVEEQNKKMYREAIEKYDKVIPNDKKYYDLAQNKKDECIEDMYEYYISKAEGENEKGEYQTALEHINYLKQYYIDDERLNEIAKEYEENLEKYSMNNEEIISLISKKSGIGRDNITVNVYQQTIDKNKFYYVEAFENGDQIDEFLIEARSKKLYSYLDENKSYNNYYSDGYWRNLDHGIIEFSISKNTAESILKKALDEKDEKYKDVKLEEKDKVKRYLLNSEIIDTFNKDKNDIYYYMLVNKGFFKPKEVYMINVYTKQLYKISENKIDKY